MPHRSRSHRLESQSRDRLTSLFHLKGWTVESVNHDYGEDLLVRVFRGDDATPYFFFVQAKAFSKVGKLVRQGEYLSVELKSDHINLWRSFREPVILTVWDASRDITYWQGVQAALAAADLRARWHKRPSPTTRIWVPVKNVLNESTVERLASRAAAAWWQLERERQGAKVLTEALRRDLGLEISYDPQYGILSIPEGTFTRNDQIGPRMHLFGRAARDVTRIAKAYGITEEQAFDKTVGTWLEVLATVARGEKAVIRSPGGRVIDVIEDVERVSEDFFRMFEESDDD